MTTLQFVDTHNLVVFLSKPTESEGFEQIVDRLNANPIRYALMINPTIYTSCIEQFWATVKVKTVNGEIQLQALVDGKKIIVTEASVRRKGLVNPTDPHHIPTIIQPSTSQPQKKQKPRKLKRKDTEVPHPSGPTDNVADEAVYEEMDDSLERAATTATSLDAKQDKGSGPRRQETMGDTIAQTGFENVSKTSNDSLLAGVNTPRSDEDSLKLKELMELLESSDEEGLDKEDASKQGRIADIDANVGINLYIAATTITTVITNDEITLAKALAELKSAKLPTTTAATTVTTMRTRPRAKGLVIHKQEKAPTPTASSQQPSQINVQDKGKGKMVEPKPVKKLSKKDQLMLNEELAFKLQATEEEEEEKEERLAKEKA
ncbi:hypothetical protein Tco_1069195 [Tanacetum coccineum]|uniref:Xylulose kinase-1 n=1 Tax=Tanacetum coccineum TaxID=301880 RepID=A0ABQ5HHU0_9ASTR